MFGRSGVKNERLQKQGNHSRNLYFRDQAKHFMHILLGIARKRNLIHDRTGIANNFTPGTGSLVAGAYLFWREVLNSNVCGTCHVVIDKGPATR